MARLMLCDELWSKLKEIMLQHRIYDKSNLRMTVVHMLVYYEVHATYVEAARREKRLKNWRLQWKLNLIETINPNGMIYMKIFAVDWDHLDAADKPRHVGGEDEL